MEIDRRFMIMLDDNKKLKKLVKVLKKDITSWSYTYCLFFKFFFISFILINSSLMARSLPIVDGS